VAGELLNPLRMHSAAFTSPRFLGATMSHSIKNGSDIALILPTENLRWSQPTQAGCGR
jgi:hypothetical protein